MNKDNYDIDLFPKAKTRKDRLQNIRGGVDAIELGEGWITENKNHTDTQQFEEIGRKTHEVFNFQYISFSFLSILFNKYFPGDRTKNTVSYDS